MSGPRLTYSEKLRSPLWQKRRLKVMEYAHWRCQICGAKDNTLHCHHSYYTKGKEPWQYPDGSIICICDKCHEKIHPEKVRRAPIAEEPRPAPVFPPEGLSAAPQSRFSAMRALLESAPCVAPTPVEQPPAAEDNGAPARRSLARMRAEIAPTPDAAKDQPVDPEVSSARFAEVRERLSQPQPNGGSDV